jgi:spore coat protein U-like protein
MRKLISRAALAAGALALGIANANAATATGTLSVSATVGASCQVGSVPVNFGSLPSTILPGSPPQAQGQVVVNCTIGTTPTSIGLDNGLDYLTTRRMDGTNPTNKLAYSLSNNSYGGADWNLVTGKPVPLVGTGLAQPYNVFGQITTVGAIGSDYYSDTVGIVVTY